MKTKTQKRWSLAANIILTVNSILALAPFVLLIIASFTDEDVAMNKGFSYFPSKWSLAAFDYIGQQWKMIGRAYLMTILVTAIGTVLSVVFTAMLAYMLSQKGLPGRKILNFYVVFTMLFNGGLVPTYIMYVRTFHIKNTVWALIFPNLLMSAFIVMLVRNYFENSIPQELYESARIDGASEFYTFFKIALPLSVPILATTGLMEGLAYWNDWQNGLYYLDSKGAKLYTIQNYSVPRIQCNRRSQYRRSPDDDSPHGNRLCWHPARTGNISILVIYPFFQKYFAAGLTLGAVKG